MNAFLGSVKADLLDVRMRLAVVVLAIALAAGVAYAVLGGSSTAPVPAAPVQAPTGVAGIAFAAPASQNEAVAETTSGSSSQGGGPWRNPFTPLPEAKAASSAATTATATANSSANTSSQSGSSSSSSTSSSSSSPPSSSHGTGGSSTPKPTAPAKPKSATVYHVALLFGVAPPGTPAQSLQLTPYEDVARLTPLPNSDQPLLVFRGVASGGKSATFTVVGEVILRGKASCLPSASQCQAIELKPGQSEELEYAPANAAVVVYQLQLVSISSSKASAAHAATLYYAESKAGRELLIRSGRAGLPGLRYSPERGVIVRAAAARVKAVGHGGARGNRRGR